MDRYTFAAILLVGGLSMTSVLWFAGATPSSPSVSDVPQAQALVPDIQMRDMRVTAQAGSAVSWWVSAEHAAFSHAQQHTTIRQIEARFWSDLADVWAITAPRGRIDTVTGDMVIEGQVRLDQLNGYSIETDRLYWNTADRTLYTDAIVRMQGASLSVTATGLRSQIDQHRLTLEHDVRASFQLREASKEPH